MSTKDNSRTAMDTALASVRRSRNKAKSNGDKQVAAILLKCEASLVTLEAEREGQLVLDGDG